MLTRPVDRRVVSTKPIKSEYDRERNGNYIQRKKFRMVANTKRSEEIVRNVTGSDGAFINSANGDWRIFRAARESVAIAKGKGNTRICSTRVDESVCMYGFMFGEREGDGDEEMVRGRRGGMDMGRETEAGSGKARTRRERWRTGKGVEIGARRRPVRLGCSPLFRGLRDLRATPQAFPGEGVAFALRRLGQSLNWWLPAPQ